MRIFLSQILLVSGTGLALTLLVSATENQPEAGVDQQNPGSTGKEGATLLAAATHPELESRTVMLPGGVPMLFKKVPAGKFRMGSPTDEKDRDAARESGRSLVRPRTPAGDFLPQKAIGNPGRTRSTAAIPDRVYTPDGILLHLLTQYEQQGLAMPSLPNP